MDFLSKATEEGYNAFLNNLNSSENPYNKNQRKHFDWETGWEIGKMMYGPLSVSQTDINLFDVIPRETSNLFDYYLWLDSIDKRLKDILLSLDTEIPTGDWKARQSYDGELEGRILAAATDGNDYIELYAQLYQKDPIDPIVRRDATKVWNIAATLTNCRIQQIKRSIEERTKNEDKKS